MNLNMYYFFETQNILKNVTLKIKMTPVFLKISFVRNLTFDFSKSPLRNSLSIKFSKIYRKITVYQSRYHFISFNSSTQALILKVFPAVQSLWIFNEASTEAVYDWLSSMATETSLECESTDVTYQCQNVCSDLFFYFNVCSVFQRASLNSEIT